MRSQPRRRGPLRIRRCPGAPSGSDGVRTLTSADLRYRVAANSGTEDGTLPPPGTPAWQQLVGQMEGAGADAEKSAVRAETAQSSASDSAAAAARSL